MSGAAKGALFDAFASVAQALGSGRRAEIVDVLAQGERSVEEIATEHGFANVEFRNAHIEQLPLDSGSADVIISNGVINLSPDKARSSPKQRAFSARAAG